MDLKKEKEMDVIAFVSSLLASVFLAYGLREVRRSKLRKVRIAAVYRSRK